MHYDYLLFCFSAVALLPVVLLSFCSGWVVCSVDTVNSNVKIYVLFSIVRPFGYW